MAGSLWGPVWEEGLGWEGALSRWDQKGLGNDFWWWGLRKAEREHPSLPSTHPLAPWRPQLHPAQEVSLGPTPRTPIPALALLCSHSSAPRKPEHLWAGSWADDVQGPELGPHPARMNFQV